MLVSRRCFHDPELDAAHEVHALLRSDLRAHLVRMRRLVVEDRLLVRGFRRLGAVGRPVVSVILSGRARFAYGDRVAWLEPGDMALLPNKSDLCARLEGEEYRALVLEWDVGPRGEPVRAFEVARLAERDRCRLSTLAEAIRVAEPAPAVSECLALLHALGAPVRFLPAEELVEPVPERLQHLAQSLDRALSSMAERPMLVDLQREVGLGERQLNRLVCELNRRYGLNAGNWRDTVFRRRVMLGAALMSAPRAATERVARRVGFGSATAFCRALRRSLLPAPAAIRGRLLQLA